MAIPPPKCKECSAPPMITDKRYKQDLCNQHFQDRRAHAAKFGDYEWFEHNDLLSSLTSDERLLIGA